MSVQRLAQSWADSPTVPQFGAVGDLGGAEREEVGGRSQEGLACWGEVGDDCRRACGDRKLRPRQTAPSGVASSSPHAGGMYPGS